jgi:hypothetical protein
MVTAVGTSIITLLATLSPSGSVHVIEPSSYAIIRQDTLGKPGWIATAEHLVLPVEWENDYGRSVLIRGLELTVRELEGESGNHKFHLVKEYPKISEQAFKSGYDFRNSLTLEPTSVSTRVLSFRSEDDFEFDPKTKYELTLRFLQNRPPLLSRVPLLSRLLQNNRSTQEEMPLPDEPRWQFCRYDSNAMITTGDVRWNWWRIAEKEDNRSCRAS